MKIKIGILSLFLLFANFGAYSNVIIEEKSDVIKVVLSDLKPKIEENNKIKISIPDLENYANYDDNNLEFYTLQFAIPNDDVNFDHKILSTKIINEYSDDLPIIPNEFSIFKNNIQIIRDVKILAISIYPFRKNIITNKIEYIDKLELNINFNSKLKLSKYDVNNKEAAFFVNILNKRQLNDILSKRKIKKTKEKFLEKKWYNPNIDYVKIETEKDAIVKIKISELIKYLPDILNKSKKYIHLLHNGRPYSFIINNNNDLINENDELIFYGLHPSADTTWWDNYSNYEAFYIYYDEQSEGLQYEKMEELISDNYPISHSIDIFNHIEEEHFYGIGTEFVSDYYDGSVEKSNYNDSRTVLSEAWYWAQIVPNGYNNTYNKNIFKTNVNLFPADDTNDKLNISLRYLTNQDSISFQRAVNVMTYFDLYYSINNILQKRDSITAFKKRDFVFLGNKNVLLPGLNQISVESKQVYIETNERTNIDFIEISGKSKPFAYNNELCFLGKNSIFRIEASGFTSKNISIFDIKNNKFKQLSNFKNAYQFVVGGISGDNPVLSLGISDARNITNQEGILVQTYKNEKLEDKYFKEANKDFNNYINSLANGTAIAIAINQNQGNFDFSSIRQLGSKIIDNFNLGKVYVATFIKGFSKFEEKIADNYAAISTSIENENGINYNFDVILKSNSDSKFIIIGNDSISEINRISKVNKTNLAENDNSVDAVYISHKNFIEKARQLANYRMNTQNVKVEVIDAEDIYKEFSYGKKSPHSIKEFLYKYYSENGLTKALLIGDASWDARKKMANSISTDWIPTYGYPASDTWYSFFDGDMDLSPDIVIGRIPVNSEIELQNYIDKVIDYDTIPAQSWMKNLLFLVGGNNNDEIRIFKNIVTDYYKDEIENSDLCGSYDRVIKDLEGASTSTQGGEIRSLINKGAIWTIYIGHAASEIFDMDGWYANSLNNKSRYGVLSTVSCNTGAFAEPQLIASRNEQYILEKDKGYIIATGSTFTGFVYEHNFIVSRMISALANKELNMRYIGDLFLYGKTNFTIKSMSQMITAFTYSLLGDPLLKIRIGNEPDAYFNENEISIVNQDGKNKFLDNDEIAEVKGKIYNYGYAVKENVLIRIIRDYKNQSDTNDIFINGLCLSADLNYKISIKNMPGRHKFTIIIDPNNTINELNKQNNILVRSIDVFQEGLLNLDPLEYWNISSKNPVFRVINPFSNENSYDYEFILNKSEDTTNAIVKANSQIDKSKISINENYIDWKPNITLDTGSYWFHSRFINNDNSVRSRWQSIPINVNQNFKKNNVKAKIQSFYEFNKGNFSGLTFDSSSNNNKLFLKRDTLNYYSLSVKGNRVNNPDNLPVVSSYVNIEVGNQVFLDGPHDLGFNLVTIKNSNGKIISRQKRFETFGDTIRYPAKNNFKNDKTPQRLVEFIRDSVQNDEYLFIATCKSSFRLLEFYKFYSDTLDYGSIDTLLYYLKQFGSKIADTLKFDRDGYGDLISFTMLGWRGAEIGSIPESINFLGDTALIQGKLITYEKNANYNSPLISKSKKWNSLKVNSNYPQNGTKVLLILNGLNSQTNIIDTIQTFEYPTNVDLSSINSELYPEINAHFEFEQTDFSNHFLHNKPASEINSIEFDFVPADEFAISKIKTTLDKEPSLRGVPVVLSTQLQNLSLRNDVDSVEFRLNVSRSGTDNDYKIFWLKDFRADTQINKDIEIETSNLDYYNKLFLNINPEDKNIEFYKFNNDYQIDLLTIKDTVKPTCIIKIDDKIHNYNDYISILPKFEIELFDNSPLQINDSTKITVRVNGYLHPYQNTLWSKFESINDGSKLKARFSFMPDTIRYEDVSIIVYISDNEGNRDTITTFARTSLLNAFANDLISYPNPSNEAVNIRFDYAAPFSEGDYKIEIYDLGGNKIDELTNKLQLGQNIINWYGRSKNGGTIPTGIYFYRINFNTNYYLEPIYGKFVIIK